MSGSVLPQPRSGKFQAPGQPLAPARLAQLYQVLEAQWQGFAKDHGLNPAAGHARNEYEFEYEFGLPQLTLQRCCDLAAAALRCLIGGLSADLIGGANVTRLDRVAAHSHPRLPYRRALRIADGRGWHLGLGEDLPPAAQASLIRFCSLLPVQILYLPGQPQPASAGSATQGFSYLLPWGGEVLRTFLPLPGASGRTTCRFQRERLVRFLLGLADTTP